MRMQFNFHISVMGEGKTQTDCIADAAKRIEKELEDFEFNPPEQMSLFQSYEWVIEQDPFSTFGVARVKFNV